MMLLRYKETKCFVFSSPSYDNLRIFTSIEKRTQHKVYGLRKPELMKEYTYMYYNNINTDLGLLDLNAK